MDATLTNNLDYIVDIANTFLEKGVELPYRYEREGERFILRTQGEAALVHGPSGQQVTLHLDGLEVTLNTSGNLHEVAQQLVDLALGYLRLGVGSDTELRRILWRR